jgi:signal transduction histidine kinase
MSRRSLTFRLLSWYCGLLFVVGVAFAVFTYASFDRYIAQSSRSTLSSRAEAIWSMSNGILDDKPTLTKMIEQRFAPEAQNRLIRISGNGAIYFQSEPPSDGGFDPAAIPLPKGVQGSYFAKIGDVFLYSRDFTTQDGKVVTVESGQSTNISELVERRLVTVLIFGLPILLIVAAAGGFVLVQRALSPVEAMIEAAEALTFNSPRKRLPLAGTEDRIDALGRTLNRMLERLDNSYQHANRFSADAAHELRTPLAIMRGELELLATRQLPEDAKAAIETTLGEAERLTQIVESLTVLGQMESVTGKRAHLAVDLYNLAAETIDQMRLMAVDKGIAIDGPSGAHATTAGDRDRLKQVLVNLLDNAIKYTQPGGRIAVTVETTDEQAILSVSDTGIGIAPEDRLRIFDRFFRVTTDRGEVGAGLGLAIVKSICAAHGGAVTAESAPDGGSIFRVALPRASPALVEEKSPE